ncbi:hypothetical protein [Anaerovibrio sp.]|uniref:hypothetical protein n=1 Tax=Anaerovibrio sp. TaxID=1872532 RepID=UPI0025B9562F|nr:hypothetical protein [Anaerovibrio sp.]MBR2142763.1 hypothetical protein [Anaerovibrio sp.]
MEKLKPIPYDSKLSQFVDSEFGGEEMSTLLVLDDYDWMVYKLKAYLRTKKYGDLDVVFEYYGSGTSEMRVVQNTGGKKYLHKIDYDTDIFEKHIIAFMEKHIKQWKSEYAFDGLDVAIAFYNEVLENSTQYDIEECPEGYDVMTDRYPEEEDAATDGGPDEEE